MRHLTFRQWPLTLAAALTLGSALVTGCGEDSDAEGTGGAATGGASGSAGAGGVSGSAGAGGALGGSGGSTGGVAGTSAGGGAGASGAGGSGASGGVAGGSGTGAAGGAAGTGGGGTAGAGSGGTSSGQSIQCGASPCALPAKYCCNHPNQPDECLATGTTCNFGVEMACDGPEDCGSGQLCCATLFVQGQNISYQSTACAATCSGKNARVVCGASGQCPTGACGTSELLPPYKDCK